MIIQSLVASLFVAGIVAAMLSTADSFLMGSAFTLAYDLAPCASGSDTGKTGHDSRRALRFGRIAAVAFIVVGLAAYWIASIFGFDILSILFGAFAAQVSLFPAVFGTILLRERAPSGRWAFLSIIAGFIAGLIAVVVAMNDPTWALYPPLFALGASIPVYAAGAFFNYAFPGEPHRQMTAAPDKSKGTSFRFWLLTGCFALVALAWFVHAVITKLELDVTLWGVAVRSVPFWKVTEVSSILVTLIVTVAFWGSYIKGSDGHTAILKGTDPDNTLRWTGWLLIFAFGFGMAGYIACIEGSIVLQIIFLVVGVLAAIQIGLKAMRTTFVSLEECKIQLELRKDEKERQTIAREVLDKLNARDNISKFLCFSDIPIAFAMVVVFVLVVCWAFIADSDEEMRVFIAGAVALQLLYSNSVYWIEAFADTPKGRRWLDRRSPPCQTIKRMLLPEECPDSMTIVNWAVSKLNELFPPNGTNEHTSTPDASSQEEQDDAAEVPAANEGDD